ncbi:uncharacterized protein NPIL_344151 [Nephila pilipes]|uniref:Ig-like domain-containing protein n=1 Tax=Nephila pilipes TaxID=299642 RepID=A0A8X6PLQ4_NEPPI|nr:uncharacterized protein NPIL_344151 [Nephila pilipes]
MWLKTGNLHTRDTENICVSTGDNESDIRIKKLSGDSDLPFRKKRKYNEEYIKFGYTWISDENKPKDYFKGIPLLIEKTGCSHHEEKEILEHPVKPKDQLDEKMVKTSFDRVIETNLTYQASRTVYLHCRVCRLGNKTVSWVRKRDFHILSTGKHTFSTDQRFTILHREDQPQDWTMRLFESKISDSGTYECQVNTEPKMSLAVQLNIIVAEAQISKGPILQVKAGYPFNITCLVKDDVGSLYFFWYFNNKTISDDMLISRKIRIYEKLGIHGYSRLFIAKAKPSDVGIYSCHPSYAHPANIILQVVKGEEPTTERHEYTSTAYANAASILLEVLLKIIFFEFTIYII